MKNKLFFAIIFFLAVTACNKKLEEDPKSILVPDFFQTSQGLQSGLDAAYAGMRNFWGAQDLFTVTVIGTDEFMRGVDGNSDINLYSYTSTHGTVANLWRTAYVFINTCNGIVDYAEKVDLPKATKDKMVAEAKFLGPIIISYWSSSGAMLH